MSWQLSVVIAVCLTPLVWGHMCLISPPQRGTMMGLNKPASADCILLKGPCGGRSKAMGETVMMPGGQNFTFTFQKNLDHWKQGLGGYFSLSIADDDSKEFREIARVPDMGEPNLHLYSKAVLLPKLPQKEIMMTLQARYVTKNPQAPAVFYQCANIGIYNM